MTTIAAARAIKPLGSKAYGSIGHLPQSRTGPGDWSIHEGQARICLDRPRRGDFVVVTEKLDGACMSVAKIGGEIVPLTRAGYRAEDGAYSHLRAFAPWVRARYWEFDSILSEGERIVGEWLALAHGTRYDEGAAGFAPFIPFDLIRGKARVLTDEFEDRVGGAGFTLRHKLYAGPDGFGVEDAMAALGAYGFHGALDPVEGAVWRVEREGCVDFLAKFVRHDKQDGALLSNLTGGEEVWNCPGLRPPASEEAA